MTIKPIETRYKGRRFRSRLEARWAVFFEAMGWQWEYEPEGFDLGRHGWYLPDFRLNDVPGLYGESTVWIEIKPRRPGVISDLTSQIVPAAIEAMDWKFRDFDPRGASPIPRLASTSNPLDDMMIIVTGNPNRGEYSLEHQGGFNHPHTYAMTFHESFIDGESDGVYISTEGDRSWPKDIHPTTGRACRHDLLETSPALLAAYAAAMGARFEHGECH